MTCPREQLGVTAGALQQLSCTIEGSFARLECLREEWDQAVLDFGGSIYMSYDWSRIWWEFYGRDQALRIFIFRVDDQIVGIAPIYIDCVRLWPLRFRVARLVGSNIPPKVFNPPIAPAWAEQIFERILLQLFKEDSCDVLSFGPVSEVYSPLGGLFKASAGKPSLVSKATAAANDVHSVWSLPQTLEEYYQSLSRNERKNRRADLKKLQTDHDARIEVVSNEQQAEQAFDDFLRQHAAQWQAEGKAGHFKAWPQATELNRALVDAHGKLGRVRFVRILVNGRVISSIYAFALGGSYYCELPARSLEPEWERLSLGPAAIVAAIEVAIKDGITRIEGGLGHYEYKIRLNAKEYATVTVRVVGKGFASRIRARIMLAARSCVLLAYHKLWYCRIAPHLRGAGKQSQWRVWLRLDF